MKKIVALLTLTITLVVGCKKEVKTESKAVEQTLKAVKTPTTYAEKVAEAHKKTAFLSHEAIKFNAQIAFGGNEIFNAEIAISTTSDIAKITYKNGDEIYVNKDKIFVSDNLKENKGARFHAYTWSYFFLYPYKLNDNGTIWDDNFKTEEVENPYNTAKLSFKANTGDAPDDWYINYVNKDYVLNHVAYIVTINKSVEKAESDPHAIKYIDYKEVNGVPFATNWEFYEWTIKDGLTNKIGNAKISNIEFIKDFRGGFKIPENYTAK